jgi:hypothetical protein
VPGDCSPPFWNRAYQEQPSEQNVVVGRVAISSREITHMQVGQCGSQEACTEVLCSRLQPSPLKQLGLSGTANGKSVVVGRVAISSREITHMQVGQCGSQEAHAEVLCRRRRAVGAIAARVNLPQFRLSR